jgi:hypothetical protein
VFFDALREEHGIQNGASPNGSQRGSNA